MGRSDGDRARVGGVVSRTPVVNTELAALRPQAEDAARAVDEELLRAAVEQDEDRGWQVVLELGPVVAFGPRTVPGRPAEETALHPQLPVGSR